MNNITLPKKFIEYLPQAHPMYSVLYVHGLACATNNTATISIAEMAQKFGILQSDVTNAWQFWQSEEFVKFIFKDELQKEIFVEFLQTEPSSPDPETVTKKILFYNKPIYSPKELELYKTNFGYIDSMFALAEKAMGRLLKNSELSTIYSFYDWLRLPIEVIEILLEYCAKNNHRNINYIEKVALDWAENEINTEQKAQDYIMYIDKNYKKILKALGQASRDITTKEKMLADKWLNQHSLDIVLEACDINMMNLAKPSFPYIDKILQTWHEKGITTKEQIAESISIFQDAQKTTKTKKTAKTKKPSSKFDNYTQDSIDYDLLEQVELKLLKNSSK